MEINKLQRFNMSTTEGDKEPQLPPTPVQIAHQESWEAITEQNLLEAFSVSSLPQVSSNKGQWTAKNTVQELTVQILQPAATCFKTQPCVGLSGSLLLQNNKKVGKIVHPNETKLWCQTSHMWKSEQPISWLKTATRFTFASLRAQQERGTVEG